MGAGHSSEGLVPRAALCIPPPAAPEQGGQDTSLARMLGAAWGKEGNLKLPQVRVLVRNEVFLPPRFWQGGLACHGSWDGKESDTTEFIQASAQMSPSQRSLP